MEQTSSLSVISGRKQERLNSGLADAISSRKYNVIMCLAIMWGFLVNAVMVEYLSVPMMNLVLKMGALGFFLAYLACAIIGILMSAKSSNPFVSFIGYNLLVLPMGVVLCVLIPGLPAQVVTKAMLLTGIVTATMTLLGLVKPEIFLGLGRTLFIALLVGIVAELIATFAFHYTGTAFDWLFVILFSGYIGYDVARSQAFPKTVDNAIDCALDIYLDIIYIFIRLLSLLSRES